MATAIRVRLVARLQCADLPLTNTATLLKILSAILSKSPGVSNPTAGAVTAGSVLPIVQYGDAAYPAIFDTLDSHGRAWLDYHAYLAETWLPLFYANAALAVGALFVGVLRRPLLPWLAGLVIVVTIGSIVGTSIVAKAGRSIKHPEFRLTDPPVVPSSD